MKATEKLDLVINAMPDCFKGKARLFISPMIYRELAKEKKRDYPKTYKGFKLVVVGIMPDSRIEGRIP